MSYSICAVVAVAGGGAEDCISRVLVNGVYLEDNTSKVPLAVTSTQSIRLNIVSAKVPFKRFSIETLVMM